MGLVGGVGSGKSSLAQSLAKRCGAIIVDGDAAGHRALADETVKKRLRDRFGNGIFNQDGTISRPALAGRVFGPTQEYDEARRDLESLTHPRIREEIHSRIEAARNSGPPFVLLDAAILLETGWRELCDSIVFVDANDDHRQTRATNRGWTPEQWRDREASQMELSEKRRQADAIIDNNGSLSEAVDQMARFLPSLGVDLEGRFLVER